MIRLHLLCSLLGATLLTACGGKATPEPDTPEEFEPAESEMTPAAGVAEPVPSRCVEREGACLPPQTWARRLCEDVYPDVALYMFREGTPFTRYYLRTSLNAVNGWGATLHEDMKFQEEVLVVSHRVDDPQYVVEGSDGTLDVLRWNGSCVTLDVNEVTARVPSRPKISSIDWRSISEEMQEAILRDETVSEALERQRKACKGASVGKASNQCMSINNQFMSAVAHYVRQTPELPLPRQVP